MSFVGRAAQLAILDAQLREVRESGDGRFVWMRGRRRVGKTRLVEEFLHRTGVASVFFQAPRRSPAEALKRFSAAVARSNLPAGGTLGAGVTATNWPVALSLATAGATQQAPVAIVLDELPYLAEQDPGFAADLQAAWDQHLRTVPVLLVAIGSDIRMMEALTAYPAELHDRPTREISVPPLSPHEVAALIGEEDAAAALDAYMTVGGFPALASRWQPGMNRSDFLAVALADSSTPLVVNALRIMEAEFQNQLPARRVLEGIGAGERVFSTIRARSGITNEKSLSTALVTLADRKRLIGAELPYAAPPGRKNKRYSVTDPYLRFWLRFIGPYLEELDRERPDLIIARIQRDWPTFRGRAVEPLAREAVGRLLTAGDLPAGARTGTTVGSYWTRDNAVEVDLVVGDAPEPTAIDLVGSVKWREHGRFSVQDARALEAQRAKVPGAAHAGLVGISRQGFDPDLGLDIELDADAILRAWA